MDWYAMLKGWRGAAVASLVTALFFCAIYEPGSAVAESQPGSAVVFLFSPDMLLVYFTAALVAVGVLTYATFNKQANIMDGTLRQMTKDATARATEFVDQIQLARDEFNATHRPKIRVRNLWLTNPIEMNKPLSAKIVLANVGDSIAFLDTFGFDFNVISLDGVLPGNLNAFPSVVWGPSAHVGLGETAEFPLESRSDFHPTHYRSVVDLREKRLYCFGFVEYFDTSSPETRKRRRTAFCRVLKFPGSPIEGNGRFFRLENPDEDYEYED